MEQTIDKQPASGTTKPRNGFIAFIFSLIPGLGQVYNGQPIKAIIFFGLFLLLPLLFGLTRGTTSFYGLLSLHIILFALRIYLIIDGVKNANRQKDYILKPYNTWYCYVLIIVGMIALSIVYDIRTVLGTQTFKTQTTANSPTFQLGDRLVVDMRAYKIQNLTMEIL